MALDAVWFDFKRKCKTNCKFIEDYMDFWAVEGRKNKQFFQLPYIVPVRGSVKKMCVCVFVLFLI